MIKITDKSSCCGCNACAEICPKHCIKMYKDKKGFFYPKVDEKQCVNCGLCLKVCPCKTSLNEFQFPKEAFAVWAKDTEQHISSSSGGIASVLSRYIIENGGIVYGCVAEGEIVKHVRVDDICDIERLRGSKYVQSDIISIYSQVRSDLKNNKCVLFIGTPCQVAGLKNFIPSKSRENLYLVDLICHGVPSQQMFSDHIRSVIGNKKINKISFREKTDFVLRLESDEIIYKSDLWKDRYVDMYYNGFIDGLIYRDSCYKCQFARSERYSDMTIGDFWGLKDTEILPKEHKNGVSVVLLNSDKGNSIFNAVKDLIIVYRRNVQEAIDGNTQLRHPSSYPKRGRLFNILYSFLSFDISVRFCYIDKIILEGLRKIKRFLLDEYR